MNENFLKSDHPAVARTKPRLSSPFPIANPAFGSPSPITQSFPGRHSQSPRPGDGGREADTQEVIPSYNEYIIPLPDLKPDDVFTEVPSESPARYGPSCRNQADSKRNDCVLCFFHHTPTHPDVELRQSLYYVGGFRDVFLWLIQTRSQATALYGKFLAT